LEFCDGEVIAMADSSRNHNHVSLIFSKILDNALADRSCEVYIADVKMQVQPRDKYFYPDVIVNASSG